MSDLSAMRKQYHFRPSAEGAGVDAWDVDRLIELAELQPIESIPVSSLTELDETYWFGEHQSPTVRAVVMHARLIAEVDPAFPIVIDPDGRVMDGMHRVARAILDGRSHVPARRLPALPPPDFRDTRPDELSYERP